MTFSNAVTRQRLLTGASVAVLVAGIVSGLKTAAPAGVDFASMYVMGRGIATGTNIYDSGVAATFPEQYGVMVPAGMFYPPATGFALLPFALLPYQAGKFAWTATMLLVLVLGVRSLVRSLAPKRADYVWMFCAGVLLLSSATRWAMLLLQGAPLVLGLLCWFFATLHGKQPRLSAVLAIIAVALKMTLSLPFLGLLLLCRRFGTTAASVGTWVALNGLGFLRMGRSSFHDYQASIGKLEALGDINSPDPWNLNTSPRMDWTSLFYGLSGNLPASRLATLALAGLVSLYLFVEALRIRDPLSVRSSALFLGPLVCLGSLCVYHHHYDSSLFFAPVLVLYFVFGWQHLKGLALWLLLPILAMMLVLPVGLAQTLANMVCGERGSGLIKLAFPVFFSLALAGSLLLLRNPPRGLSQTEE